MHELSFKFGFAEYFYGRQGCTFRSICTGNVIYCLFTYSYWIIETLVRHCINTPKTFKWPPFRRRHYKVHFLEWRHLNSKQDFIEIYSLWCNRRYGSIIKIMAWCRTGAWGCDKICTNCLSSLGCKKISTEDKFAPFDLYLQGMLCILIKTISYQIIQGI